MPATVVVYDSASVLPPTFVGDEGLAGKVALVTDLAKAHRLGRAAEVLVIVGGGDQAGTIGLLTSAVDATTPTLLLYLADAEHHHRVLIHGARRGATIMIGEPLEILAACLRDIVARPLESGRRAITRPTVFRPTSSPVSPAELCLLMVAARRAATRRREAP
jgi:hypothetical protein